MLLVQMGLRVRRDPMDAKALSAIGISLDVTAGRTELQEEPAGPAETETQAGAAAMAEPSSTQ